VVLVGWPLGAAERDQQEALVRRIGDRMSRLGEERGRAADRPADALDDGDRQVRRQAM
jgi:hypothetical protein